MRFAFNIKKLRLLEPHNTVAQVDARNNPKEFFGIYVDSSCTLPKLETAQRHALGLLVQEIQIPLEVGMESGGFEAREHKRLERVLIFNLRLFSQFA